MSAFDETAGVASLAPAGAGRDREREAGGEVAAPAGRETAPPTGLLDLPDELLIRIYAELVSRHPVRTFISDESVHTHFFLPLRSILVNRRIYRVALPLRQHSLVFANPVWPSLPEPTRVELEANLRFLELKLCNFFEGLPEVLPRLKSLSTLRLSARQHLPRGVTDSLKQCTQLRHLYLAVERQYAAFLRPGDEAVKEDSDFSFERDLPFLESLVVNLWNGGKELLNRGIPPRLQGVGLFDTYPDSIDAPWWTVPRVHFYPLKGYFRDPWYFVDKVREVIEPDAGFAVKHLIIQVDTVSPVKGEAPDEYYYEQVIPEMLELLQRTDTLERLDFVEFQQLEQWDGEVVLPTIKTLRLSEAHYGRSASDPNFLKATLSFLALFPSLTTLLLAGCTLLTPSSEETITSAASNPLSPSLPDPTALIANELLLAHLLTALGATAIVDLRYRLAAEDEVELRFWREKGGQSEGFQGEWYWI
ncbi:hypothetical protein JCM6882_000463 [Rhodosporidiobolus microsporus]